MMLFPPFHIQFGGHQVNMGYGFILSPPTRGGTTASVDEMMLATQWLGVLTTTLLAFFAIRHLESRRQRSTQSGPSKDQLPDCMTGDRTEVPDSSTPVAPQYEHAGWSLRNLTHWALRATRITLAAIAIWQVIGISTGLIEAFAQTSGNTKPDLGLLIGWLLTKLLFLAVACGSYIALGKWTKSRSKSANENNDLKIAGVILVSFVSIAVMAPLIFGNQRAKTSEGDYARFDPSTACPVAPPQEAKGWTQREIAAPWDERSIRDLPRCTRYSVTFDGTLVVLFPPGSRPNEPEANPFLLGDSLLDPPAPASR